jgi:aryl-alcohol dehydrogenase-like predicted oxidoreductase
VRAAAEASLRRLGRQAIDLYEVLEPDPALPLEGVWEAMAALVDAGLAHQIGVCNFSLEQVSRCERVRHVDAVENQFSLLHREEHEVLSEHCARAGTAFIAYGPLALGLLTGKIDAGRSYAETSWGRGKTEEQLSLYQRSLFGREVVGIHLGYVERLRPLAARAGLPLAQLALAWVTQQDDFTVAIAGSTSPENTRQNAAAGSIDLPRWVMEELAVL